MCRKKVFFKICVVLVVALALLFGLIMLVGDQHLDQLKHSLSLGTIILLVVILNVVSFICFIVMYGAYQWIRTDLKDDEKVIPLEQEVTARDKEDRA